MLKSIWIDRKRGSRVVGNEGAKDIRHDREKNNNA